MSDLLQQGSDWLEDQRTRHATRIVTYHRGLASIDVSATVGRTVFEVVGASGVAEKIEARDYLLLAADLVIDDQRTLPNRGDRIRETVGSTSFLYEVMAPGREPHYRYSDPYRKTLRIHTKHVDTLEAG